MKLAATWIIAPETTEPIPTFTNDADRQAYQGRMDEIKAIAATRSIEGTREERKAQMKTVDQKIAAMRPAFNGEAKGGQVFHGTIEL